MVLEWRGNGRGEGNCATGKVFDFCCQIISEANQTTELGTLRGLWTIHGGLCARPGWEAVSVCPGIMTWLVEDEDVEDVEELYGPCSPRPYGDATYRVELLGPVLVDLGLVLGAGLRANDVVLAEVEVVQRCAIAVGGVPERTEPTQAMALTHYHEVGLDVANEVKVALERGAIPGLASMEADELQPVLGQLFQGGGHDVAPPSVPMWL